MTAQTDQVYSYQREVFRRMDRRALPDADDVQDPASWPYPEFPYPAADGPPMPGGYTLETDLTLADLSVGPREVKCLCGYVHNPAVACGELW